eukprot:6227105-Prymnesium_polylepis.1
MYPEGGARPGGRRRTALNKADPLSPDGKRHNPIEQARGRGARLSIYAPSHPIVRAAVRAADHGCPGGWHEHIVAAIAAYP